MPQPISISFALGMGYSSLATESKHNRNGTGMEDGLKKAQSYVKSFLNAPSAYQFDKVYTVSSTVLEKSQKFFDDWMMAPSTSFVKRRFSGL